MDAGLVRKLQNECRFLPVRFKLSASALPPLLSGIHSPEITGEEDIKQLINDIHGVVRKPPLGPAPRPTSQSGQEEIPYSPGAIAIARLFVERTENGALGDLQFSIDELAQETQLTVTDIKDALYELSGFVKVVHPDHVFAEPSLFTEFDRFWKPWNPAEDALKLAGDIANDPDFPDGCREIADRYGWQPRRLNPAITYLSERGTLADYQALNTHPFVTSHVIGMEDEIRRFVKSRS